MTGFIDSVGALFFTRISPGSTYVVVTGLAILVLAVVRLTAGKRGWMRAWLKGVAWFERGTITLLLISMVLLSLTQIILRNFFSTGLIWVDPLLRHAVLWIGFLGAALATARDRHINIDVLSRLVRGGAGRGIHALLRLLAAGVTLALSSASYRLLVDEFEFKTTSFLSIPVWVLMSIMPFAMALMSYRFVLNAWRGPQDVLAPAPVESELPAPSGEKAVS